MVRVDGGGKLARKSSKRPRTSNGTSEARTHGTTVSHDRAISSELLTDEDQVSQGSEKPVKRDKDVSVDRATRGLIRLEGRRRRRTFGRRLLQLILVCGVLSAIGYYGADYVPKAQLHQYWQDLESKLSIIVDPDDDAGAQGGR